ncbi:hypothetical protein F5888DRAFT_1114956 [Russula emetica]|nr:hypothetical protein F5888DRAFT_1114956 [Russula emetica]
MLPHSSMTSLPIPLSNASARCTRLRIKIPHCDARPQRCHASLASKRAMSVRAVIHDTRVGLVPFLPRYLSIVPTPVPVSAVAYVAPACDWALANSSSVRRLTVRSMIHAKLDRAQDLKKSKGGKVTKSRTKVNEDSVNVTDADLHPLATLHLDNFNNISGMLSKSWYRNDTEQMVVVFAKDQYNDKEQLRRSKRIQNQLALTMAKQREF